MDEQFWTPVALALATRTAETLAEGAKSAITALVTVVRRRFERRPDAQAALDAAEDDPSDPGRIQALSTALRTAAAADPDFAEALRVAWREVSAHVEVPDPGNVNHITGAITGNVVQARDISGGVTFGQR
ncbi:hypothetical protein ABT297_41890 [Dactylosporangium sp. NPDC000555]|uniref:hypothetical protein n=1 Tax=Dactylosporangium sp. NPDC000555 TaxID=3154260 RepID=UPI00332D897A